MKSWPVHTAMTDFKEAFKLSKLFYNLLIRLYITDEMKCLQQHQGATVCLNYTYAKNVTYMYKETDNTYMIYMFPLILSSTWTP